MREDYRLLREQMVEVQLKRRGIRDSRILDAFKNIPREYFVPEDKREFAYEDRPLSIGLNQTISQPYMVALMTEVLKPLKGEKILEVGTGSGYQTAILAYLGARVYSIERYPELMEKAKQSLRRLNLSVDIKVGDGSLGWPEESPFVGIIVTAGALKIPPPLLEQLDINGRFIAPVGGALSQSLTKVIKKDKDEFHRTNITNCVFVPLVGKFGFKK